MRRRWAFAALLLVLSLAAAGLLAGRPLPFDPARWETADRAERQRLARDFAREYAGQALTRDEVTALLGEEPDYGKWPVRYRAENTLVYDFGAAKGPLFDPPGNLTLVITFGEDGRAVSCEVLYDQW